MNVVRPDQFAERVVAELGQGGSDGGDNGRVEARLSEVEKAIVRIDGRFDLLFHRMDEMADGIKNLRWWIAGALLSIILAVIATAIGIQQMTVATFQSAAAETRAQQPPASPAAPTVIVLPTAPAASKP